jgi:hypothetical protein
MRGAAIEAHRHYYIVWSDFREATTRRPRDVDPTRLVAMFALTTHAKTLPELAGHLGMLEPSENFGYDDTRRRVLCNVERYHTAAFSLCLARAIVEKFELACSYLRMMHALLARYHPEMANAYRPSAAS